MIYISRCIAKVMHIEKPKWLIICDRWSRKVCVYNLQTHGLDRTWPNKMICYLLIGVQTVQADVCVKQKASCAHGDSYLICLPTSIYVAHVWSHLQGNARGIPATCGVGST